jgi:signal peptidase II
VRERNEARTLAAIAALVAGIDQLTKLAVSTSLGPGGPGSDLDVVNGWVRLEYVENRGAAFGLFAGLGPLLAVASIAILVVMLDHFRREGHMSHWQTVAIGLIVGGAVGNLIDRIRLGYVVDFVAIGPWPNFNVADSAVTLGVVALLLTWTLSGAGVGVERVR